MYDPALGKDHDFDALDPNEAADRVRAAAGRVAGGGRRGGETSTSIT